MKLVVAEKPSVAMALASVLEQTIKKTDILRGMVICKLVPGASVGTGTAGRLRGTVCQVELRRPSDPD